MADELECLELAAYLLDMEDKYEDWEEVWDRLYELHGIDEGAFQWLINKLIPTLHIGESLLKDSIHIGFAKRISDKASLFFIKTELPESDKFKMRIAGDWIYTELDKLGEDAKGFEIVLMRSKKDKVKLTVEKLNESEEGGSNE